MDRQSLQQYCESLFTKGEHPGEVVAHAVTYREIAPYGLFVWRKNEEHWSPCQNDRLWQLAALEAIDRHWPTPAAPPAPTAFSVEQPKAFIDETGRRWVRGHFPGTIQIVDGILWRKGPDGWQFWSDVEDKWRPNFDPSHIGNLNTAMAALWP
jgi:hypothetical protein